MRSFSHPENRVSASPIHGMAKGAVPTYSEAVRFCRDMRPIVTEADEICGGYKAHCLVDRLVGHSPA
jgi:hypothetical protein